MNKKYLIISGLFLFLYHTFDNLRVFIVARSLGINYSFLYGYAVSLINTFGATITPAHLGGEMLPFYTLRRVRAKTFKIMSVITIKALSGFIFFVVFFPITVTHLIKNPKEALEFLIVIGSIIVMFGLCFFFYRIFIHNKNRSYKSWKRKIKFNLLKYFVVCRNFFRTRKFLFFITVCMSLFMYLSFIAIGIFLVLAFNGNIEVLNGLVVQLPLVYAIFISPTPGGSGVGEIGALLIFEKYISSGLIGSFAIIWRFLTQYISAIFGGFLFIGFTFKDIFLGER